MNKLYFKLSNTRYIAIKWDTPELGLLGSYLMSDFSFNDISFNSWINWFNDDKYDSTCSNSTSILKVDNDIEIYWIFDEDFSGPYFQMNKEKFIKFLHEWRDLALQKPQMITVTQRDDGSLVLERKKFHSKADKGVIKPFYVRWISKIKRR